MKTETESRNAAFTAMALTIPAVEAAVGRNWLPVMIAGLAAWLLCFLFAGEQHGMPGWLSKLRVVGIVLLTAWILERTPEPWHGRGTDYVVPLLLLMLAVASVKKGAEETAAAAGVLRYGVYGVLAVLLGAGAMNLRWRELKPKAELPDGALLAVLLLPLLADRRKERRNPLIAETVLVSIVTAGTGSLYLFSRGITIRGAAEHLESIAASAITVGYFGMLCWLLDRSALERGEEQERDGWKILLTAAAAYGLYLTGIRLNPWIYVGMELVLWGILPLFAAQKRNRKKREKSA